MKIIGVTGTSGAGKTTLCAILKENYGAYIIDADQIAKRLAKKGSIYLKEIVEYFGSEILDMTGELKRKELAKLIYENDEKREKLNQLTFLHIVSEIKNEINEVQDEKYIVVDAPLLFESDLDKICDFTIGIVAKEEEKIDRICKRDDISCEMAKKRLNIQITDDEIYEKADFVIENNGNVEILNNKIKGIIK